MVPVLRFPQFDKNWYYVTMETLFPKIRNGFVGTATPFYVINGVKYLQGKNIKHGQIIDKDLININQSFHQKQSKSILKKNDLVMVQSGHVGECAIINDEFHNSNCHALLISSPIDTIESIFYKYFFYAESGKRNIYKIKTGNTIEHILSSDLKKITIPHPAIKEQQKIADFLSSVDKKIEQLTRKKELLEKYKTGMMQKLFPKAGEQHPELRFKDENGQDFPDWDVRKVGDIAQIFRGASPRPISSPKWFSNDSLIGWVRISDVTKSKKYLHKTEQYLSNEGVNKSRFIEPESLIMSICATIGQPIYTKFPVCIHDGFVVFSQPKVNPEYLYYYLDKIKYSWHRYGQPGTQINLNSDIVRNENISIPNDPEQQKIADFLSAIDDKITKVEGKLIKAQTFKKGLLQQMFV
jgi:type I restriction enzyme, S subunit